jgi:biotin operon repressor
VPVGRTLTDADLVEVTLTLEVPPEEVVEGEGSRRRSRLLRLLGQAEEQGGLPTIDHLAAALSVSPATVKRDLQMLRAEGFPIRTRGSRTG